jgi:putative spermidine/putrescine transport system permease protein
MKVTLPLSRSGVIAGVVLVFAICLGAFATPHILGGGRVQTLATLVRDRMVTTLDWGQAAAIAIVILVLGLAVISSLMWIARPQAGRTGGSTR